MADDIKLNFKGDGLAGIVRGLENLSKYSKDSTKDLNDGLKKANDYLTKHSTLSKSRVSDNEDLKALLEEHNRNLDQTMRQERTRQTILKDYVKDYATVNKFTKSASRFIASELNNSKKGVIGSIISGAGTVADTSQFIGSTLGVIGAQFAPIIKAVSFAFSLGKGILGLLIGANVEAAKTTKTIYSAAGGVGNISQALKLGVGGSQKFKEKLGDVASKFKLNPDDFFDAMADFGREGGNILASNLSSGGFEAPAQAIARFSRLAQMDLKAVGSLGGQLAATFGSTASNISGSLNTIFEQFEGTGIQAEKFVQTVMAASENMSEYGNTTGMTSRILNKMANSTLSSVNAIKMFNRLQDIGPKDEGLQMYGIQQALKGDAGKVNLDIIKKGIMKQQESIRATAIEQGKKPEEVNEFKDTERALKALENISGNKSLDIEAFNSLVASLPSQITGVLATTGLLQSGAIPKQQLFTYSKIMGIDAKTVANLNQDGDGNLVKSLFGNQDLTKNLFKRDKDAAQVGKDTNSILDTISNLLSEFKTKFLSKYSYRLANISHTIDILAEYGKSAASVLLNPLSPTKWYNPTQSIASLEKQKLLQEKMDKIKSLAAIPKDVKLTDAQLLGRRRNILRNQNDGLENRIQESISKRIAELQQEKARHEGKTEYVNNINIVLTRLVNALEQRRKNNPSG